MRSGEGVPGVPSPVDVDVETTADRVGCPRCAAAPGEPCVSRLGNAMGAYHRARLDAAADTRRQARAS